MSVPPQIVVRLAIDKRFTTSFLLQAFTVLKHKPKDQSIPSYLLDLQSPFPLLDDSQASSDGYTWRHRALTLEKELESLKQRREEDEEELIRLRQNISRDLPEDSDAPPQKKKTKKSGKAPEPRIDDWAAQLKEWAKPLDAKGQLSPSIIAAFTSLRSVLSLSSSKTGDKAANNSRLLAAITRSLLTVSSFLGLQNITAPSFAHSELNESRIAMAYPLLVYVLRVAFPALFHQAISTANSTAISHLIDAVFVPIVHSFVPASRVQILHYLGSSSAKKTSKNRNKVNGKVQKNPSQTLISDTRMDLLTLLDEALNAFDSISPSYSGYTAGVRERVVLEAIRALESLYSTQITVGTVDSNASQKDSSRGLESSQNAPSDRRSVSINRKDRHENLARKDAVWYLCHILNSCVSRGGANDGLRSILSVPLLDGAARLVKMCVSMDDDGLRQVHGRCVMDVVCKNMVLASCEKIIGAPQETLAGP